MTETIENITNPETFHAMLAEIKSGGEGDVATPEVTEPESIEQEQPENDVAEGEEQEENQEGSKEQEVAQEDDDDDGDAYEVHKTENGAFVPLGRFKKTQQTTKALKEQLNKQQQEYIALKTHHDAIQQAINQYLSPQQESQQDFNPGNEEFEPLDTEADRHYKKQLAELKQKQDEIDKAIKAQEIKTNLAEMARKFSSNVPDYNEALNYYAQKQAEEVSVMLKRPKEEVADYTSAMIDHLIETAYNRGDNPAETLYNLAKAKGYAGKKAEPKREAKPDLEAIERNMKKSVGIKNIEGTSAGSGSYVDADVLKRTLNEKGGVIPSKFHEELKRIQRRLNSNS